MIGLQGRIPNTSAGNWFQCWMVLFHAILTETLACFLPGRAKDLSAPMVTRRWWQSPFFNNPFRKKKFKGKVKKWQRLKRRPREANTPLIPFVAVWGRAVDLNVRFAFYSHVLWNLYHLLVAYDPFISEINYTESSTSEYNV